MDIQEQIRAYLASQPKRSELEVLHNMILQIKPESKLWFLDGKNSENKTVSNSSIGYGMQTIAYADGKTRAFYKISLSANTAGISVYILGIKDKDHLAKTYGNRLGKASVSGYCIKFKTLKAIDVSILEEALRFGFEDSIL